MTQQTLHIIMDIIQIWSHTCDSVVIIPSLFLWNISPTCTLQSVFQYLYMVHDFLKFSHLFVPMLKVYLVVHSQIKVRSIFNFKVIMRGCASRCPTWYSNTLYPVLYWLLQLMVLDSKSGRIFQIPSLKSSDDSEPADCPCGIHSIALNPSRTLFATGAENTNDLAIYQLPTFDPVMVGEVGYMEIPPRVTVVFMFL